MHRLVNISKESNIPDEIKHTPIGQLVKYHNLGKEPHKTNTPQLLICTCMDHRINLFIPANFAYVIRTGGANMSNNHFHISYALSMANIKHIAIIGHTDCGMANLHERKKPYLSGLRNTGFNINKTEIFFQENEPENEIVNEIDFTLKQANELSLIFTKITIIPMLYKVENNLLFLIKEANDK